MDPPNRPGFVGSGDGAGGTDPQALPVDGSVTGDALADRAEDKFDYVYRLAAYAAAGLSHSIRRFNRCVTPMKAAVRHGCRCVVLTSSIAVNGAGQVSMDESTAPEPDDPYFIARHAVEPDPAADYQEVCANSVYEIYARR